MVISRHKRTYCNWLQSRVSRIPLLSRARACANMGFYRVFAKSPWCFKTPFKRKLGKIPHAWSGCRGLRTRCSYNCRKNLTDNRVIGCNLRGLAYNANWRDFDCMICLFVFCFHFLSENGNELHQSACCLPYCIWHYICIRLQKCLISRARAYKISGFLRFLPLSATYMMSGAVCCRCLFHKP